jgi:hypothetical protein
MARNQGSSMQNGSKLGHSKYEENGPEKSPSTPLLISNPVISQNKYNT